MEATLTDDATKKVPTTDLHFKLIAKLTADAVEMRLFFLGLIDFMVQREIASESDIVSHLKTYTEAHLEEEKTQETGRIRTALGIGEPGESVPAPDPPA